MIKELYQLSNQLKNTSGRNDMEEFIKRHRNNDNFLRYLEYVINPMNVYGIQTKKLNKFINEDTLVDNFDDLFECFEYLKLNNTGKDLDVKLVASYINSEDEKYRDWLIQSVTKTFKVGVTGKSINKALGYSLIPEFNVMLAHPYEKHQKKVDGKEVYTTEKKDGVRILAIVEDGTVKAFTRQGHAITGLVEIEEELSKMPNGCWDGELLIINEDNYKDREVLQETLKISRKEGEKTGLNFWLFDYLPLDEFQQGKSKLTYAKRREYLDSLQLDSFNHIHVLPVLYKGTDMDAVREILVELEKDGKEGVMLNLANGYYECKRSANLLKMKTFLSFDEKICDIISGDGRLKNTMGAIKVMYKGKYPLHVGTGFTDEQRDFFWKNKESLIGKVIEIQYFRESRDKDGNLSVSFPVFVAIREDKDGASYN